MTQGIFSKCTSRYIFGVFLLWGFLLIVFYFQASAISAFIAPHIIRVMGMSNKTEIVGRLNENRSIAVKSESMGSLVNTVKPVPKIVKNATTPVSKSKKKTEKPIPKQTTPKPKPKQTTPKPILKQTTPKPILKQTTPKPKPKQTTPKPKPKQTTPKPILKPTTATPRPKQACVIPKLDIDDPSMMKFYKKVTMTVCPGKDWVYVDNGTLRFSPGVLDAHNKAITCDYFSVIRETELKNRLGPAIKAIAIPFQIKDDAFKVVCKGGDGQTYENFHQGVAYRQEYVERKEDPMTEGFKGMSIAILGFDSMSRMSWLRRLPITRKYFAEELGAIELEQHNVLGDGTTAVMFPMLTGKFEWELPEARRGYKGGKPMDDFPWIWNDFKKAGYLTSWSNAKPKSAPFNWRFYGFTKPPTDFYSRTFYVDSWTKSMCIGSQNRMGIWLNWSRDMFHMYKKQRKFLFNFITDFSHDGNNILTPIDEPLKKLVQHLHDDGYLNNTLLILMGDHGARYGSFRYTINGKLEERLPYFSFLFPQWFQKKYPEAIKNLKTNTKRLTTPFDLHETFKEFFKFTGTGKGDVKNRGISLLKEIPLERTCKHAGVASHWCACLDWKTVSVKVPEVQTALKTALDTMNGYTKDYRSECALLSIANVSSSTKMEQNTDFLNFKKTDGAGGIYKIDFSLKNKNERALYQLMFTTTPGGGQFEVTVTHDYKSGRYLLSEKEISRINMYGNAPHCIVDKNRQLQPYCYCKDLL